MSIQIIEVTSENRNLALELHVKSSQSNMIESVEECLNEADEVACWRTFLVEIDDQLVGFAMMGLWEYEGSNGRCWLDRFFIDERYQGKGYSKKALVHCLEFLKEEYHVPCVYLSVYADNYLAIKIYESLGFRFNNEIDTKGEKVMVKHF